MSARLRIGEFARLAKVSVRTLRHYEDEGLLRPAHVDRHSRYRYYDTVQLLLVQRLLVLRDLGVSIPEIREVLRGKDGGAEILRRHRARLQQLIDEHCGRLRQLNSIFTGAEVSLDHPPLAARLRSVPATIALTRRTTVRGLGAPVTRLFESLERTARSVRIDASPFLLFHSGPDRRAGADVEVCIPVEPAAGLPGVRTIDGVASACCLVYQGAYRQTSSLYDSMLRWVARNGASASGPLREVYHRFGADQRGYRLPGHRLTQNPADYVTELQLPLMTGQ